MRKEKEIPKEPIWEKGPYCPNCTEEILTLKTKYCYNCGQAIDMSGFLNYLFTKWGLLKETEDTKTNI